MKQIDNFVCRVVFNGDSYGLNDCLTHDESMPLVEFYDSRFPITTRGQFVARYFAETLLNRDGGLNLYGGVPDWRLTADQFKTARRYILDQILSRVV